MCNKYKTLAEYFAGIFPGKIRKITVNAGMKCPNRDGTVGTGGCIYCNNSAFSPSYAIRAGGTVTSQIRNGIQFSKSKGNAWGYLPYFQTFTGTYGNTEILKALYEEALQYPKVAGIVIATRPDCISDDLLDWMDSRFGNKAPEDHPYLLVEVGIESTIDRTLSLINRGHSYECACKAVNRLNGHGIPVGAHIILGLPGENHEDFMNHARRLSELPLSTLKLHQLQIVKGTELERMYQANPNSIKLFTVQEYAETVAEFISLSNKDLAFDRFVSESPRNMVVAPSWGIKPAEFQQMVNRLL